MRSISSTGGPGVQSVAAQDHLSQVDAGHCRGKIAVVGIGPGHAVGLSFSVAPDVSPIPRSLVNIFRELTTDLGVAMPTTGDLTPWADRGVLLLNRVLTVRPGTPASHRGKGWEEVTARAIDAIAERAALPCPFWCPRDCA